MDNKKYIFCRNCGEKYDEAVKFCRKCGKKMIYHEDKNNDALENEIKEETEVKDKYIKEKNTNKENKKLPVILIILLVVFILCFGTFEFISRVIFSSDKLINKFEEGCNNSDIDQLKEILISEKTGKALNENEIEHLVNYFKDNPSALSEVCNDLKSESIINSDKKSIYIRKVNSILGEVGKKEIVLKPEDIKIYVPTDNIKILIDDKEYTSEGKEYINITSLYIGKYDVKAEYTNSFRSLEENIDILINYNNYQSEYSVFDDIKTVNIDTQYYDAYVVLNGENTGKTVAELNYTLYPMKSDDKVSLEYTKDNETFSSESKLVSSNNYLYFNSIEGLDNYLIEESSIKNFENNLERSVRELMQEYSQSFAYAINNNNFENVAYLLYPGSNIYNIQQEYINKMALKDYYISFISLSTTDIKYDESTKSGSVNAKEVYDTYLDGEYKRLEQNYVYSFKYNDNEKSYQITDIK